MKTNNFNLVPYKYISVLLVALLTGVLGACSQKQSGTMLGAGATFPYPLYSEMFVAYEKETGIKVNYQSIGSGGGIKQILEKTINFGATDAFIKDAQLAEISASGNNMLHIPITLGAVVVAYNVPGVQERLRLDGNQLAQIFSGKITKWNDPILQGSNPNVTFPDEDIIVVHRSDSSGTTAVFTDFLVLSDVDWAEKFGAGKTIEWFEGAIGSKGNEGVASTVAQTAGSISYLNFNYAITQNISTAVIKNLGSIYVEPSIKNISAAAAVNIPDDTRIGLSGLGMLGEAYPISTFTWIIVYENQLYGSNNSQDGKQVVELLRWMVTDGQKFAEPLYYAPLPQRVQQRALEILDEVAY